MRLSWLVAALLVLAASAPGVSRAERRGAGGSLAMSVRGAAEVDAAGSDERVVSGTGHVDLRALYGRRLAAAVGVGFELGAERPAGFAYALRLQPIGGAVRFGRRGWLGLVGGAGVSGVIDRVPVGLELPVTAFVAFDLGRWVRVSSRLRASWIPTSSARSGGSRALDVADELDFEAGLALGRRESKYRSVFSDGTYVGVFAREQLGQRIVGISIALAISGAGRF